MATSLPLATQAYDGPPAPPRVEAEEFDLTNEFMDFECAVKEKARREWHITPDAAQLLAPLHAFFAVLHQRYNNSIASLLQRAGSAGENTRLSTALAEVFAKRGWSVPTSRKYAASLKQILSLLELPGGFVTSLRLVPLKRPAPNKALSKYGALPADHPVRVRLEGWADIIRDGTRNKSDLSVRNLLSFFYNSCLPALGLDLQSWPEDVAAHVAAHLQEHPDSLRALVHDAKDAHTKAARLQFLLREILGTDVLAPKPGKKRPRPQDDDDMGSDGHDIHRISTKHLELLHQEAAKDPLDALFFMLMLTTGLRIGGVAKILTRNVADIKNGQYITKKQGQIKEKGEGKREFRQQST